MLIAWTQVIGFYISPLEHGFICYQYHSNHYSCRILTLMWKTSDFSPANIKYSHPLIFLHSFNLPNFENFPSISAVLYCNLIRCAEKIHCKKIINKTWLIGTFYSSSLGKMFSSLTKCYELFQIKGTIKVLRQKQFNSLENTSKNSFNESETIKMQASDQRIP